MAKERCFKIACIEGFDVVPTTVTLVDDSLLLKEVPYGSEALLENSVVKGRLRVVVKNTIGEILGSLSIEAMSLPEEGSYWLPLADTDDDLLEAVPAECRSPCLLIDVKPMPSLKANTEDFRDKDARSKAEGIEIGLKTKILGLEQALKAEKWKRQELADSFKQQLDAAAFKTEKLQATLKKTTEKLVETETKLASDNAQTTEDRKGSEERYAEFTRDVEQAKAELAEERKQSAIKDEEIACLHVTLAELANKSAEEAKHLQNEVLRLQHQFTQLHETKPAPQDENEVIKVLSDELDLCKRMIRSQQLENEKQSNTKAKPVKLSEEKLTQNLKESNGKVEELKYCITELSEQNQLLTDELANVQDVLREQTAKAARGFTILHDSAAEAEMKAFLKKKKLEHKVKIGSDGHFFMQDVVVRPFKRQQQLYVGLECSLAFFEKCVHTSRSCSVSAGDISRKKTLTPLRDNRTAPKHKKASVAKACLEGGVSRSDSSFMDRSLEYNLQPSSSRDDRVVGNWKENKRERWVASPITTQLNDSIDTSIQSLKSDLSSTLRKKTPFK